MKWGLFAGMILIISGCCCTTTKVVEYRQVTVAPVVEPVYIGPQGPIDVTTTTIDFY